MRIRISIAVEVDPQEWADEYGCALSDVREDVQALVRSQIDESVAPVKVVQS